MEKELKFKFLKTIKNLEGKEYLASIVAFAAAPTLKGKKPSSLISLKNNDKKLINLWKTYKDQIKEELGFNYFEIKDNSNNILVLIYKERMLEAYLSKRKNIPFLISMGYKENMNLEDKLLLLKDRFKDLCPHEVGIFLGIPIEDVEGFIKHGGQNCLMCRYWKVYDKPKRAENLFKVYDIARCTIVQEIVNGELENITS